MTFSGVIVKGTLTPIVRVHWWDKTSQAEWVDEFPHYFTSWEQLVGWAINVPNKNPLFIEAVK